jgi:hypothetical protein
LLVAMSPRPAAVFVNCVAIILQSFTF